jgi:hypothetical protein
MCARDLSVITFQKMFRGKMSASVAGRLAKKKKNKQQTHPLLCEKLYNFFIPQRPAPPHHTP